MFLLLTFVVLFVQYLFIEYKLLLSWIKLHNDTAVRDNAVKVTLIYCSKEKLIKMLFPLWEGQGNSSLSVYSLYMEYIEKFCLQFVFLQKQFMTMKACHRQKMFGFENSLSIGGRGGEGGLYWSYPNGEPCIGGHVMKFRLGSVITIDKRRQ